MKKGFTQHQIFTVRGKTGQGVYPAPFSKKNGAGFTLVELLIVIAIIAIIAAVVFVALNPLTRFQDARDADRWSDVNALYTAIKLDQIDNGGAFVSAIAGLSTGIVNMIGTDTNLCTSYNSVCDTNVSGLTNCVDLSDLVTEGYLPEVPISPNGAGTWIAGHTGYTIERESTEIIRVRACESENTTEISASG
jgi:prepilin-type N-terminal cleavage/methylation domain-containing protein